MLSPILGPNGQPYMKAQAKPAITGRLARPTYVSGAIGKQQLTRSQSFQLLAQFYTNIPILGRAIDILSGFVGTPKIIIEGNEAATKEVNEWAETVPAGYVGQGLKVWLPDLLRMALLYGYGVCEAAPNAARNDVERLWSYDSRCFRLQAQPDGAVEILQPGDLRGEQPLDPVTSTLIVHRPHGGDPHGQSLFFSSHTFCQALLDITHAHQAMWRRSGIPTYHVNWRPNNPESFDDSDGELAEQIKDRIEESWNGAVKSQVVNGVAQDFYSTGEVTVTAIGSDIEPLPVEIALRSMLEEIVAATGIPPFVFGLMWSTTERMSTVQAELMSTTIRCLRWMAESSIRRVVGLRQRLTGQADQQRFTLEWPNIALVDLESTARAAMMDAQAKAATQKTERQLWADGVTDQQDYAEALTGKRKVKVKYSEPPTALPEGDKQPPTQDEVAQAFEALRFELAAESGAYETCGVC